MTLPTEPAVQPSSARPAPVKVSWRDLLPPVNVAEKPPRLSMLLYGKSGVGKTSLCGTAEDDDRSAPVLVLDSENGYESIAHRIVAPGSRITVTHMENFRDTMNNLRKAFYPPPGNEPAPFKLIVLDSVSETGFLAMQGITTSDTPEIKDWQKYASQLRQMVSFLRDLPVHLIVIAAEKEDDEGGTIGPAIQGGIRENLPGFFNTVARLTTVNVVDPSAPAVRKTQRKLMLQNSGKAIAKDRMDKLGTMPNELINPTVATLLDRLEEGRRQQSSAAAAVAVAPNASKKEK